MGFYNSMSKLLSLVCIICAKLRCVSSSDDGYGTEWLMYTIDNGSAHIMNFSTLPDNRSWQYGNVYFNLYTRNNSVNPESLKIPEKNADIESQYFVASKDTKVLAHGWLSSGSTDWIQNQKNAYLDRYDYNVIIVDWHELAQNPVYPWAALCTRYVGKRLAKLLDSLVKSYQARAEKMHLIGHSLGAQIMGQAGMFFNKTIHRITGLDPARPLFEIPPMSDDCRLDKGDAGFVDIIHTAAGVYGYEESHGQADYYPNGGKAPQPGCSGPLAGADATKKRPHHIKSLMVGRYFIKYYSNPSELWRISIQSSKEHRDTLQYAMINLHAHKKKICVTYASTQVKEKNFGIAAGVKENEHMRNVLAVTARLTIYVCFVKILNYLLLAVLLLFDVDYVVVD